MPVKLRRGLLDYDIIARGETSLFDHGPNVGDLDDDWLALDYAHDFARDPANLMTVRAFMRDVAGVTFARDKDLIRAFAMLLAQNHLQVTPTGDPATVLKNRVSTHTILPDPGEGTQPTEETHERIEQESACKIHSFVISCAHAQRTYKVQLPGNDSVIQVISGSAGGRNAKLKFEVDGTCAHGADGCPEIHLRGHGLNEKLSSGKKCDVVGKEGLKGLPWRQRVDDKSLTLNTFLGEAIWPDKIDPVTYYASTVGCYDLTKKYTARIEAFTNVEWNGKFKVGFDSEKVTDADGYERENHHQAWKFELAITYKIDKEEYQIVSWVPDSHSAGVTGQLFGSIFNQVKSMNNLASMEKFVKNHLNRLVRCQIDVLWPNLQLEGWFKNVENDKLYLVETESDVNIALDPIIGATVKFDILDWVITILCTALGVAPLARVLTEAKRLAAEGFDAGVVAAKLVIALEIEFEGKVWGKLEFKKTPSTWTVQGEVGGMLGVTLTGRIEGEGKVLNCAYVKAGGTIGAMGAAIGDAAFGDKFGVKAGIQPKVKDGKAALDGFIGCSGLKLYYALYLEVGIGSNDSNSNAAAAAREPGFWGWCKAAARKVKGAFTRKFESANEALVFKASKKDFNILGGD